MKNELTKLITEKRATVGVIGLGYVGLPLVVEFAAGGFKGIGFEVDNVRQIKSTPVFRTSETYLHRRSKN